jgi:hypothetical protein
MFEQVHIECSGLSEVGWRFEDGGAFHSVFFRRTDGVSPYPVGDQGWEPVLAEVLTSTFLAAAVPDLQPVDADAASRFTVLDRFEFEGSLTSRLLRGACTYPVVADEAEARARAREILDGTLAPPGCGLVAFRMDDEGWSPLTRGATFEFTYLAFGKDRTWWFVCFADFY